MIVSWEQGLIVKDVPTHPIEGQKTGTSGLRKKTKVGRLRLLARSFPRCNAQITQLTHVIVTQIIQSLEHNPFN